MANQMDHPTFDPRIGTGNWEAFPPSMLDDVFDAACEWAEELEGIEKPWLCWCVDPEWCVLQQKLVESVGWTPIVGVDRPTLKPNVLPGSQFVNFNGRLKLPAMWMHFPLEFAFLFTNRLAFWHSDVLPPLSVMEETSKYFEPLKDGAYIGTSRRPDLKQIVSRFRRAMKQNSLSGKLAKVRCMRDCRWFEVIGCTTRAASKSQFDHGCGFWRHIEVHPNRQLEFDYVPHYEHGTGIWYWQRFFGGEAIEFPLDIEPYHYTTKSRNRIKTNGMLDKQREIRDKYQLQEIEKKLGL